MCKTPKDSTAPLCVYNLVKKMIMAVKDKNQINSKYTQVLEMEQVKNSEFLILRRIFMGQQQFLHRWWMIQRRNKSRKKT